MISPIKFSILVPVYKVEAFLPECIESVLNQTYGNFELILVDDGSPDRCGEICDEYAAKDDRVKVFHKPNGGQMSARCYGIKEASGDYYLFLDSDDYIAPNALEVLSRNIEKYNADCIIFALQLLRPGIPQDWPCHEAYTNRLITDKAEVLNLFINDHSFNSLCRKCTRSSCFDGRDFSRYFHISRSEDRLQSTEILENASTFLFIPDTLYYYRVNPNSTTHTVNFDGYKADFTVEEYCISMLDKLGVFSHTDFDRMRNFSLDILAVELKRLSRFCSSRDNSCAGLESIWQSDYYKEFLITGYRKAPALPGLKEPGLIRRLMNRIVHFLFRHRFFSLIIFFNRYIYK